MAIDRSATVSYANTYWYQPCKDGKAWLANEPVIIANEISKRKLSSADWTGAFLGYMTARASRTLLAPAPAGWKDLYLIKRSDAGRLLSDRKASSYPGAIMLASWYDKPQRRCADQSTAVQRPQRLRALCHRVHCSGWRPACARSASPSC